MDGEGEERVDFTYIDDVVNGVIASLTHDGARNEIFNMTAGKARSLKDLVTLVQEHFPEIEVEYVERDNLRPFRGTLLMGKAAEKMDHHPATRARGRPVAVRRVVPRDHLDPRRERPALVLEDAWLAEQLERPAFTLEAGDRDLDAGPGLLPGQGGLLGRRARERAWRTPACASWT